MGEEQAVAALVGLMAIFILTMSYCTVSITIHVHKLLDQFGTDFREMYKHMQDRVTID